MNMQKRIFYAMVISSVLCTAIYAISVFLWKPVEVTKAFLVKTYISNIILGLLGSSVISGEIAFISYLQNRRDTFEKYIFKYHELTSHCSKYMDINDYAKKVEWFNDFVCYVRDLETIWSDIGFIFDPKKKRLFLKDVADYYNDFIWLTENYFRLLNENISEEAKRNLLEKIDNIVIEKKKDTRGVITFTIRNNRLTADMASVNKAINEIYKNKKIKAFMFDKSLVSRDVFVILDNDIEKYVKKMIELMKETGKTEIELDIPVEVCKKLQETNYISSYSIGKTNSRSVNCQFILFHYFDLKKKCRDI